MHAVRTKTPGKNAATNPQRLSDRIARDGPSYNKLGEKLLICAYGSACAWGRAPWPVGTSH